MSSENFNSVETNATGQTLGGGDGTSAQQSRPAERDEGASNSDAGTHLVHSQSLPDEGASSPVQCGDKAVPAPFPWRLVVLCVIALCAIPLWLILRARGAGEAIAGSSASPPSVAVTPVLRQDLYNEENIPAEFRPYQEVELHAKVSGYVREIKVDFGDRVKAGQLLATLEVPELLDQLHNAVAVQQKAEADYRAAHLNYTRLLGVATNNPNLVAQQDLDTALARDATADAAIAAAKADAEKFQTLVGYTRITAPFDGVITHRYVDTGTLVQAGTTSDTQTLPIVRLSDNYRLRLDFPVSVKYVKDVRVGAKADVRVDSLGGKTFSGAITRATQRVNGETRTMTAEMEVANPDLEIVPGMYARLDFKVQSRPNALSIPIEAVSVTDSARDPRASTELRKGAVFVINKNNELEEREVTLGLETPTRYEVVSGLQEGDLVMVGDRLRFHSGQKVTPVKTAPLANN